MKFIIMVLVVIVQTIMNTLMTSMIITILGNGNTALVAHYSCRLWIIGASCMRSEEKSQQNEQILNHA